jgi:hypothetical protein
MLYRKMFAIVGIMPSILASLSCSGVDAESSADLETTSQAVSVAQQYSLSVTLPPGLSTTDVTLAATGRLRIGQTATITGAAGGVPTITNMPAVLDPITGATYLDSSSNVGNVFVKGQLTLRDRVVVSGYLKSDRAIAYGTADAITGPIDAHASVSPASVRTFTVTFPATSNGNIDLTSQQRANPAPGRYAKIEVDSGAALVLGAGTYYADTLNLRAGGTLSIDSSGGPIQLYVASSVTLGGSVLSAGGASPKFLLGYLGSGNIDLKAAFAGTLLAPKGSVLIQGGGGAKTGQIFAKTINTDPDAAFAGAALTDCSIPLTPDGTACNDGNPCTQTDRCVGGACVGTSPVVCTAQDACHGVGQCDQATGACSNPPKPDGTTCDDGNKCTQTDTCAAGVCVGSNPITCTGQDPCKSGGTCDPASGLCGNAVNADGASCKTGSVWGLCKSGACASFAASGAPYEIAGASLVSTLSASATSNAMPLGFAALAAGPIDISNGNMTFSTPYDNPEVIGKDQLQTVIYNGQAYPEHAAVDGANWGFDYFDLRFSAISAIGDASLGSQTWKDTQALLAKPTGAIEYFTGSLMPFLTRGIGIGYGYSYIKAVHSEIEFNKREQPSVNVYLDPTTILVPIYFIRAVSPNPASPNNAGTMSVGPEDAAYLFDRVPVVTSARSMPGNTTVMNFEKSSPLANFYGPDNVWDQCGIQFRAVPCGAGAGTPGYPACPDLVMAPAEIWANPDSSSSNRPVTLSPDERIYPPSWCLGEEPEKSLARKNIADARALTDGNGLVVLVVQAVDGPGCNLGNFIRPAGIGIAGGVELAMTELNDPLFVYHELGHALGLDLDAACVNDNVMCSGQPGSKLTRGQCAMARSTAKMYASKKWPVTLDINANWPIPPRG